MSDYEHPAHGWENPNDSPTNHDAQSSPEPDPAPARKRGRGPRRMVEVPTQRFEGQMYVRQYEQATQIMNRLKREKQAVPSEDRRRLTVNSLVRVAMTVLLEHKSALRGTTEAELLESFRDSLNARAGGRDE